MNTPGTAHTSMSVAIIGAGVAGLSCACELLDRGQPVTIYEQSTGLGQSACSWLAGGMIAPWCERESAEQAVLDMGQQAKAWWLAHVHDVHCKGSLVLSMQRDNNEIRRYARLTENHQSLDRQQIAALEPDLGERFERGLWFAEEAHLDPRQALSDLADYVLEKGGQIKYGHAVSAADLAQDKIIDCRGFAAQADIKQLRGVKGEMLILQSDELRLSRPVRLLHPRFPLYIVPRGDGQFMLGATMIENEQRDRITARSMLELLSAAYALHPVFGEAQIVEIGVDVRPAYADNLPALSRRRNILYVNGLYRHGFLLGPALAKQAADAILDQSTFMELNVCVSS